MMVVPRCQARPGGCTRIHRLESARSGDNARWRRSASFLNVGGRACSTTS
ncbi:MAG: hypothetical protein IPK56_11310 [Elusimicrobia bacterium]|nr:hypothetical protein [Elusimicrobiota bacterium]